MQKQYVVLKGQKPFMLQQPYRKIVRELGRLLAGCYEYSKEDRENYYRMSGQPAPEPQGNELTELIGTAIRAGLKDTKYQPVTEVIIARIQPATNGTHIADEHSEYEMTPKIARLLFVNFPESFNEDDLDEGVVNAAKADFFTRRKGT